MTAGKCSCGHYHELHRDGRCAGGRDCPCVAVSYDEDDDRLIVNQAALNAAVERMVRSTQDGAA